MVSTSLLNAELLWGEDHGNQIAERGSMSVIA